MKIILPPTLDLFRTELTMFCEQARSNGLDCAFRKVIRFGGFQSQKTLNSKYGEWDLCLYIDPKNLSNLLMCFMGIEIERKFLIHSDQLYIPDKSTYLRQGYLAVKPSVRVRVSDSTAWLTIKFADIKNTIAAVRPEYEYEIPWQDGSELLIRCDKYISKIRHEIKYHERVWTVDEFLDDLKGLWIAEIEIEKANIDIDLPPWIDQEVTHDLRYRNKNLLENGIPS